MIPGEIGARAGDARARSPGASVARCEVLNTGDRPVQVGSHFHFADVNAALAFDREAAAGFRLDVLAGTSVRFEPGARGRRRARRAGRRADAVAGLQVRR